VSPALNVICAALLASFVAACNGTGAEPLPLELTAFAVRDTAWPGDSLLVGWTVRNPSARRTFRDYAAFYRITIVGPDGRVVAPEYDRRGHGASGERARDLGPRAEVRLLIDLGCVSEPLIPRTDVAAGCALRYRRPVPGAYLVVIQHVPLPRPDGSDASHAPEFEPSHADTVTLYVASGAARPE
jgi:hypothetical protein